MVNFEWENEWEKQPLKYCRLLEEAIKKTTPHMDTFIYKELHPKTEETIGCVVDFVDTELKNKLKEKGIISALWSSRGTVHIDLEGNVTADIPITQLGEKVYPVGAVGVVKATPGCKISEIHLHDSIEPGIHIHIDCAKEKYQEIAGLINRANAISRMIMHIKDKKR